MSGNWKWITHVRYCLCMGRGCAPFPRLVTATLAVILSGKRGIESENSELVELIGKTHSALVELTGCLSPHLSDAEDEDE